MIKWCHKAVFYLRTLSIAVIYSVSGTVRLDSAATVLYKCSTSVLLSSGQWTKTGNLHTRNGSFWKRQALDGNEQRNCFLLLHFRIISNLESCQQYVEDVLQAGAHTASSSPRQVTEAHVNDILIMM